MSEKSEVFVVADGLIVANVTKYRFDSEGQLLLRAQFRGPNAARELVKSMPPTGYEDDRGKAVEPDREGPEPDDDYSPVVPLGNLLPFEYGVVGSGNHIHRGRCIFRALGPDRGPHPNDEHTIWVAVYPHWEVLALRDSLKVRRLTPAQVQGLELPG